MVLCIVCQLFKHKYVGIVGKITRIQAVFHCRLRRNVPAALGGSLRLPVVPFALMHPASVVLHLCAHNTAPLQIRLHRYKRPVRVGCLKLCECCPVRLRERKDVLVAALFELLTRRFIRSAKLLLPGSEIRITRDKM